MFGLKLFTPWTHDQTSKIDTQLRYQYKRGDQIHTHPFEFNDCRTNKEFEIVCKRITDIVDNFKRWTADGNTLVTVRIKLDGKLNGKDLHERFQDVETYRQFLENNALIPPRLLSVVIHRT